MAYEEGLKSSIKKERTAFQPQTNEGRMSNRWHSEYDINEHTSNHLNGDQDSPRDDDESDNQRKISEKNEPVLLSPNVNNP